MWRLAIVALLIPGALQRESHSLRHSAAFWHLHCFSAGFESRGTTTAAPLFLTWNNSVRHSQCTSTLNVVIITCSRRLRADPESAWSPLSSNQSWYESAKHSPCNDGRLFNIAHHYFNEWMNVLNLENMPLIGAAVFWELLPRCEPPGFGESLSCADGWATWS